MQQQRRPSKKTGRAATVRIVALTAYTKAAAEQAAQDVSMARQIQRAETAYLTSVGTERTDTELERTDIEAQLTSLAESLRTKGTLTSAYDGLRTIEGTVRNRATMVTTNASAAEGPLKQFEDLAVLLEQREAALRKQITALEEERTKWNGYYTARLARARIECSVTGIGR
ncbi:MAG: hypothetical protein WDO18_17995 [Acidobacteriota bacterium]